MHSRITNVVLILLSEIVTKLYFRSNTGTAAYMAPELLRKSWKESDSSKPADVYAFGVILWEAMHQRRATTRSRDIVKSDEPVGYVDLMNVCLENKPERRPPFKTIRESLMWMMKQTSYQSNRPKNRGKIPPRKPIPSISSIVAAETRKVKAPPPPSPTRTRKVKAPAPPTPTRRNKTKPLPPRKPIASISSIVAAQTRKVKRPPPPTPTRRKNQTSVVKRDMEAQDFDDTTFTDASELGVGIEIDMDDSENDKIDMMDL